MENIRPEFSIPEKIKLVYLGKWTWLASMETRETTGKSI